MFDVIFTGIMPRQHTPIYLESKEAQPGRQAGQPAELRQHNCNQCDKDVTERGGRLI